MRRPIYKVLYFQVLVAVIAGLLLGAFFPATGEAMKPLGDGFIKLVKMIIAPVIFCTVVIGIASMRDVRKVGRVGGKALLYFEVVSTFALVLGIIVGDIIRPGDGFNANVATIDTKAIAGYTNQAAHASTVDFIMNIIPNTMFSAFSTGEILQVLLVAILSGFAISSLTDNIANPLLHGLEAIEKAVFAVVKLVMYTAPIGAFGAMAFTIGKYGISSIGNLLQLIATFYVTALLFVFVVLGAIGKVFGFSVFKLVRYIKDELLIVLGTSSSESALPALIQKMEHAGASRSVVGLVVPTGYSFNLDGTNIYMTLATLFIAQATNTHITWEHYLLVLGVAMLTSKGASGVTGSGFITLAATLAAVPEIPIAGMALILGVDRFMSECRSLTNFTGNAVATLVVARWEGELDMDRLHAVLDGKEVAPLAPPPPRQAVAAQ